MKISHWRKGNASILVGTLICALGIVLMAWVAETVNIFQGAVTAQTRADLIADGSAAYGMSYDNSLDPGRVMLMSSILLASSADFDNPISMQIDYGALANNQVRVLVSKVIAGNYVSNFKGSCDTTDKSINHGAVENAALFLISNSANSKIKSIPCIFSM